MLVNERYLIEHGYTRDRTCPSLVVRYEKTDARQEGPYTCRRTYWISVTLNANGTHTQYGVANFHDGEGYIAEHRSFEKAISTEDFEKFSDRKCLSLPDGIKTTRKNA